MMKKAIITLLIINFKVLILSQTFPMVIGRVENQEGKPIKFAEVKSDKIKFNVPVVDGSFTLWPLARNNSFSFNEEITLTFIEEFTGLNETITVPIDENGRIIIKLGPFKESVAEVKMYEPRVIPLDSPTGQQVISNVGILYNYINVLSNKEKSIKERTKIKNQAKKIFKPDAIIQVSNNETGEIKNRTVSQYLYNLMCIKSDVAFLFKVKKIKEVNFINGKYWINADVEQLYIQNNEVTGRYEDKTGKQIQFEKDGNNYLIRNLIVNDERFF